MESLQSPVSLDAGASASRESDPAASAAAFEDQTLVLTFKHAGKSVGFMLYLLCFARCTRARSVSADEECVACLNRMPFTTFPPPLLAQYSIEVMSSDCQSNRRKRQKESFLLRAGD